MLATKAFNSYLTKKLGRLPSESYRSARLLFLSVLLSLLFGITYFFITFITGFLAARYAMVACVVCTAFILIFFSAKTYHIFSHLFMILVWLLTMVLVYFSGSMFSSMLSWLVFTPLVALLILNTFWQRFWLGVALLSVLLFYWLPAPTSNWVYASSYPAFYNSSLVIGLVLMVYLVSSTFKKQQLKLLFLSENQNDELRAAEEELRQSMEELSATQDILASQNATITEKQQKTERYLNTLISLAMSRGILEGDKERAYQEILSVTSGALNTSRVSIWHYFPKEQYIQCIALFDKGNVNSTSGLKLFQKDFPSYFEAILEEKVIVAEDARSHSATSIFTDSYLNPLNIYAMLDVPYIENGKFQGVICCEHQNETRSWDQEDVLFVKSVADLVCMAINSAQRKEASLEIDNQRARIQEQNEKLVAYAEEIKQINASLENRVAERTATLHEQNKQLTEYAFVNAHLLRGPLSRILGLVEIIRQTTSQEEINTYIDLLDRSTKELDKVVHRITDILNEGRKVDRQSMRE